MFFIDPLEQFDILHLVIKAPCIVSLSELYLPLYVNVSFFLFTRIAFCSTTGEDTVFMKWLSRRSTLRTKLLFIMSRLALVFNGITSQISASAQPLFLYSFLLTLLSNLLTNVFGILPFTITLTAQALLTLFLALSNLIEIICMGISYNGLHFLCMFIPSGVPLFLLPLLVFVDILSFFSRMFSLFVRLFANLFSGHLLIKIVSIFLILSAASIPGVCFGSVFVLVMLLISLLEVAVSFLQAYVWLVLTVLYFDNMVILQH